jgi:hypothetical protein
MGGGMPTRTDPPEMKCSRPCTPLQRSISDPLTIFNGEKGEWTCKGGIFLGNCPSVMEVYPVHDII